MILNLFSYLSVVVLSTDAGGRRFGKIGRPERGTVSLLGIHAGAEHPTTVRQGARHPDKGATSSGSIEINAAVRQQFALPIEEVWQCQILQPFLTTTTGRPFRQRTQIVKRRTERSLLRQPAEADAVQSGV